MSERSAPLIPVVCLALSIILMALLLASCQCSEEDFETLAK